MPRSFRGISIERDSSTRADSESETSLNAQRKPTLLFVFVGPLFKFEAKTPLFAPSFQLPPRKTA